MASFKLERFSENVRREVSLLVRNLKNLKEKASNFSVSRVEVLSGGSVLKIYVSSINGVYDAKIGVSKLKSASGFIKRRLSNKFRLKKSPELEFVADDYVEYGAFLDSVFQKIKENNLESL